MINKRLNIAMLSVHSCPMGKLGSKDTGGMNVYIRELARELGRLGHSVDIYTRAHDPADPQIIELGDNVRLIHLQVGDVEQMHKLVLYTHLADMACSVENYRKNNNLKYDLIHSHYWLSGWVGKQLQIWWNIPHIIMFHTLATAKNSVSIGEEEPELRVVNERELIRDCHRIITATAREKDELIQVHDASSQKIGVVPCGVNLDLFKRVDKEIARKHLGFNGSSIILFVGRIDPLKGIDNLLESMSQLSTERDVKLILVGGGDEEQPEVKKLLGLSRRLNIQDAVTFVGTVSQEELPLYYSAADVCAIPSYYESFGLVALESLACGTPVVSTRVGGMENIISQGHNGYLIKDNAPNHLADSISTLLSESACFDDTAESIRESVNRFNWSSIAQEIQQEYYTVLNSQFASIA